VIDYSTEGISDSTCKNWRCKIASHKRGTRGRNNCGSLSFTTLLTVDRGSESTVSVLLTESGTVRQEALDIEDAVMLAFP